MTRIEIERSLEKAVAKALGVELPKRREGRSTSRRTHVAPGHRHEDRHIPA